MYVKPSQILEKLFYYITLLLPILFILGSAILNISIVFLNIIFFIHIIIKKDNKYLRDNRLYIYSLIIFLLFQFSNNFINENYEYFDKSIYYLRFLFLPLIFKYFSNIVKFNIQKISKFYLILLFLIIIDLFYQYIFDVNLLGFKPGLFNSSENLYERYSGIFNTELILGSYLSSFGFLIIILYYIFNKKSLNIFLLLLGILFISIFLTGERSSLLNFLISLFFIFLFIKEMRKKILFSGLIIIIISAFGIISSDQLKLRYFDYPLRVLTNLDSPFSQIERKDKNYQGFSLKTGFSNFINNTHWGMHYKTASKMFIEKPIHGHGFKQFRNKCKNYSYIFSEKQLNEANSKNGCSTHPHHYILEILSEQGLIGLTIFLFIIICTIKDSLKNTNHRTYILILLAVIFGYMLPLKPSGSIISTWFSSIFWLMLSFSYIKSKN